MAWRVADGVSASAPSAFLTGAKTSAGSPSTTMALHPGEQVEDESLVFDRIRLLGLAEHAVGIDVVDSLPRQMERQGIRLVGAAVEEIPIENVHRDTPGPEEQTPVRIAPLSHIVGQVAVFDDPHLPVDHHDISDPLGRMGLADHLARHLGFR